MIIEGNDIRVDRGLVRIGRLEGEQYQFLEDPLRVISGLKRCTERVDLFTFTQRVSDTTPQYGLPFEWHNIAALPVTSYQDWWSKTIDNKTRNVVRRAEKKGVEVREVPLDDDLVRGIWNIYNETPVRRGKRFRHFGKDIKTVYREEATFPDHSVFVGAYFEKALIGFIKLTADHTRTQAGLMNILSLVQHRDKAPTNALVAKAVQVCAERGIPHLFYGSFVYGNKRPDSLSDFKRNSGFRQVDVPRYYVPITGLGQLALKLGMHRRLHDRVPEPVLAKVLQLRSAWYKRRFQAICQASSV